MYQQITLIGNLGGDPEMRYTPSGVPVTNFNLAVNRRWTNQEGQPQEKTHWFRITTWRRQAEVANQYLAKGRRVMVVGELDNARAYTDREGNPRVALDVTARELRFLEPRENEGAAQANEAAASAAEVSDIPF